MPSIVMSSPGHGVAAPAPWASWIGVISVASGQNRGTKFTSPNDEATGPVHAPLSSCSEKPAGVVSPSATPMSVDVSPVAGPVSAVNVPS